MTNFDQLPEACLAQILSLTSPLDACKSSLLSSSIHHAANSDFLWEKFLPSDYKEILPRLASPVLFKSKKELFMKLCTSRLIDEGAMTFSMERRSGSKCYKLGARELSIAWSCRPLNWCWKPSSDSRYGEIVELVNTSWLEIKGSMNNKMLSPNTYYRAYLVINFANRAYGLDRLPSELLVELGTYQLQGFIYLRPKEKEANVLDRTGINHTSEMLRSGVVEGDEHAIRKREDGWWEVEMGEFWCDGSDKEVKMSLKETKGEHLKGGLIVAGIELRPKPY